MSLVLITMARLDSWNLGPKKVSRKGVSLTYQQRSAGKVMLAIFWDRGGTLLANNLPYGKANNSRYYAQLIKHIMS